ncbi:MAG: DNRLRE domain-containing protein [Verrucomicrobia bacterium]|nr:DNRLRE domain-containing protein [Verrucomicrobiota bacterium]
MTRPRRYPTRLGCLLLCLAVGHTIRSETVTLTSAADTSLVESAPDNNLGGEPFVPAGVTQNRTRAHGLFRFDFTGQIPPQATVLSATLVLQVTGQPSAGYMAAAFDLHRLLKPWGEGTNTAQFSNHPGIGAPATTNDATWNMRFAFTTNAWTVPGASPTNDYAPAISAQQFVYDVGNSPYVFGPTPSLTADVQAWVDHPDSNFGWLLMADDETANFTARRFGSREDPNNAPQLTVEFIPPLRLLTPRLAGGRFSFTFPAAAGQTGTVEFCTTLAGSDWTALTNFVGSATATNLVVSDPILGPQRFYRVVTTNAAGP